MLVEETLSLENKTELCKYLHFIYHLLIFIYRALSMSNEEKILMRQYGQNYENVINPSKKTLNITSNKLRAR